MVKTQKVTEGVTYTQQALRIDEEKGIIHGVRILGRASRNGYTYSDRALREAKELYDGVPVFIDHRDDDSPRTRPTREHWGRILQPRVHEDGVYGDLEYLKEHRDTAALLERARRMPNTFGLSHDAFGAVEGDVVTTLAECESVDIVTRPATNTSLFESERRSMPKTISEKTVSEALKGKRGTQAKHLRKLLEMDEFSGMSEESVEVDDPSTPEDEMQASVKAMVNAILDDPDLDASAKIGKIRKVLNVAEKLADAPKDDEESEPTDSDAVADDAITESLKDRLARIERREMARDLLEEEGHTLGDLDAPQRKLLMQQKDEDDMRSLIESWSIGRSAGRGDRSQNKPPARPLRETESEGSYADQLAAGSRVARSRS